MTPSKERRRANRERYASVEASFRADSQQLETHRFTRSQGRVHSVCDGVCGRRKNMKCTLIG